MQPSCRVAARRLHSFFTGARIFFPLLWMHTFTPAVKKLFSVKKTLKSKNVKSWETESVSLPPSSWMQTQTLMLIFLQFPLTLTYFHPTLHSNTFSSHKHNARLYIPWIRHSGAAESFSPVTLILFTSSRTGRKVLNRNHLVLLDSNHTALFFPSLLFVWQFSLDFSKECVVKNTAQVCGNSARLLSVKSMFDVARVCCFTRLSLTPWSGL